MKRMIFAALVVLLVVTPVFACPSNDPTATATAISANSINNTANGGAGGYANIGNNNAGSINYGNQSSLSPVSNASATGGNASATIQKGAVQNTNNNVNLNSNSNKNTNVNKNTNKNTNVNNIRNSNSQKQGQVQGQGQKQSVSNNNGQTISPAQSVVIETPRDFIALPTPVNVQLIPYVGQPNSLYTAETLPWMLSSKWTTEMIEQLDSCYFGCDIVVVKIGKADPVSGFEIGTGKSVLAVIYASTPNPGTLWGNVAKKAQELGAVKVMPVRFVSNFEHKSGGASFYLSGGLSTIYGQNGDKAAAGSSGVGFGTATAKAIESANAAFVLYSK